MSSNAHNAAATARLFNPWVFHLQKLALELKCPLCLHLLKKPMLLPCNHILCSSCVPKWSQISAKCPACQEQFLDQDVRPASYMENIVGIYKSLDATFNSTILPLSSAGSGIPISISTSTQELWKQPSERAAEGRLQLLDGLLVNRGGSGAASNKCSVSEELDVKLAPEMSPRSSPSVDAKDAGCNGDQDDANRNTWKEAAGKSVDNDLGTTTIQVDNNDKFHKRESKRQKKLSYGSSEAFLQRHEYKQHMVFHSEPAVVSYPNEVCKFKDPSIISTETPFDAAYAHGSICAFCHSSKITEGTGPLLYYANGKEAKGDEIAFSNAIPVHIKCIEWTPQVYFAGEMIMNLESELARASKLKCSKCGLKGAALGCFAKSCRRTYHVPCAMETSGCRWDCEDFVMLCPSHKSIKFPSEKSNSRKRHRVEKCSLPTESASLEVNFWVNSSNGPQEWVLCGSALSSGEKSVMTKFATICGATVLKSWSPDVTHVVAATDSNGAYSRTLKVLMAVLNGRWIVTMDWIRACVEANCPVDEEPYEINLDNHGFCDGPKLGRLKFSNNAPKLFEGLSFYFNGDFIPSFKSDLIELVRAGGGTIIESKEQRITQGCDPQAISTIRVVYNHGSSSSGCAAATTQRLTAENVARDINALVIPHTWILESIAACTVLPQPI